MAAYQKIGDGIALLDECPEVRKINEAEVERLRRHYFQEALGASPDAAAAKPKSRPARTKRKGK